MILGNPQRLAERASCLQLRILLGPTRHKSGGVQNTKILWPALSWACFVLQGPSRVLARHDHSSDWRRGGAIPTPNYTAGFSGLELKTTVNISPNSNKDHWNHAGNLPAYNLCQNKHSSALQYKSNYCVIHVAIISDFHTVSSLWKTIFHPGSTDIAIQSVLS